MKTAKRKILDFLFDVAKYVLTAAIVMSFLGEFGEKKTLYYAVGIAVVTVCIALGLYLAKKIDQEEKNDNN
jgi:hypothetical protein